MKIKCLVADDEPPARELLISYISRLSDLEVAGQCKNGLEAFEWLQRKQADIIFLDIQMPGMNGLDLIRTLHQRPTIILTTAFREHAVDAFEQGVTDYLVKPISFERFLKAIARHHYITAQPGTDSLPKADVFETAYMFFKVNKDMVKISLKDIIYAESIRDYLKIVTNEKSFITYQRISYLEEKLPQDKFIRIHKSYIVATQKITTFRQDSVRIGKHELPVGRVYKRRLVELLNVK